MMTENDQNDDLLTDPIINSRSVTLPDYETPNKKFNPSFMTPPP